MLVEFQTPEEFCQANGPGIDWPDPSRPPGMTRRWLHQTGAVSSQTAGREIEFQDAPIDEEQRLRLQEQHQRLCVQRAAAAFAGLRKVALGGAGQFRWPEGWAGPAPEERFMGQLDAVAGLRRLAEIHDARHRKASELEQRISELPQVAARRREAERQRQEREAAEEAEREMLEVQRERIMAVRLAGDETPADAGEIDVLRADHQRTASDDDHWAELAKAIPARG